MTWNVVMGIGIVIMIIGFLGFIWCEMEEREIDRKIAENDRFINAMLKARKDNNNG
jgi:hypothetical protein